MRPAGRMFDTAGLEVHKQVLRGRAVSQSVSGRERLLLCCLGPRAVG
jgi:hypothetical protein